MGNRHRGGDPFHDIKEWQDHRYDPGYFTGGRVHPVLRGRRPNKYGWVLMATGLLSVLILGAAVRTGDTWLLFGLAASAVINLAAGTALIRRRKPGSSRR
jgi:hypothetical protein